MHTDGRFCKNLVKIVVLSKERKKKQTVLLDKRPFGQTPKRRHKIPKGFKFGFGLKTYFRPLFYLILFLLRGTTWWIFLVLTNSFEII